MAESSLETASSKSLHKQSAKRTCVDMEFCDIGVTVQGGKVILNNVSGKFCHGQLTAIIGCSGAGKSTLMDVLTGYRTKFTTGKVLINGNLRNLSTFHSLSCYIMQENLLQPYLTVLESVKIAASLKLGQSLSNEEQTNIAENVLNSLGLTKCQNTRVEKISGGERKRLTIALELVNDPPILFLDEPTSGLDYQASKQCIKILQSLARQGRTIICSIHQPSASILNQFDQLYVMAQGQCVYQGLTADMVPFFSSLGYNCPLHYNPADYVIEITQECSMNTVCEMAMAVRKSVHYHNSQNSVTVNSFDLINQDRHLYEISSVSNLGRNKKSIACITFQFLHSTLVLMKRMLLQQIRAKIQLFIAFSTYIFVGGMMGVIFYDIGNNSNKPNMQLNFIVSCAIFASYTQIAIPVLLFPEEVKIFRREHFNNWYSLNSYYTALVISRIPIQVSLSALFAIVPYYLTGHPMEIKRLFFFWLVCVAMSFVAEALGLVIGSICGPKEGAIVGPALMIPILILAQHNAGAFQNNTLAMKILMSTSYIRLGIVGLLITVFEDREPLPCYEDFCYFSDPGTLLRFMGADGQSVYVQIGGLFIIWFFYKVIGYLILYLRITPQVKQKLSYIYFKLSHKKI